MGSVSIDTSALRSWAGTLQSSAGQIVGVQGQVASAAADLGLLPSGAALGLQAGAAVAGLLEVDAALEGAASSIITQAMIFEAAQAALNASYQAYQAAQQAGAAALRFEEQQLSTLGSAVHAAWTVEQQQLSAVGSAVQALGSDIQQVGGDIHTWCVQNQQFLHQVADATAMVSTVLGVAAMCLAPVPGLGEAADAVLEVAQVADSSVNLAANAGLLVAGDNEAAGDMALTAAGLATDGIARGIQVAKAGGEVAEGAGDASKLAEDSSKSGGLIDKVTSAGGRLKNNLKQGWNQYKDFNSQSLGDMAKQYGQQFVKENLRPDEELGKSAMPHFVASSLGRAVNVSQYALDTVGQGNLLSDGVNAGFSAIAQGASNLQHAASNLPGPNTGFPTNNPYFQ